LVGTHHSACLRHLLNTLVLVLAIETSCDETSVAIVKNGKEVLANVIASQIDLHAKTGGVVPEVAAREHILRIQPCIEEACQLAGRLRQTRPLLVAKNKNIIDKIDLLAVTAGPGLIGCLLTGVNAAKTLSYVHKKPLLGVNHIEGHIYANFLERDKKEFKFPILVLTVSGGHNELVLIKNHCEYELIGESLDDAAGEAFDKVARILELGYPGGPAIEKAANEFEGDSEITFPRAWGITGNTKPSEKGRLQPKLPHFNFSFSGLKTAALQMTEKRESMTIQNPELAKAFQEAIIDVLSVKTLQAALKYGVKEVHLAGGVSANKALRKGLEELLSPHQINFKYPKQFSYCTDNAAMIAAAAYFRAKKEGLPKLDNWKNIGANPGLNLV